MSFFWVELHLPLSPQNRLFSGCCPTMRPLLGSSGGGLYRRVLFLMEPNWSLTRSGAGGVLLLGWRLSNLSDIILHLAKYFARLYLLLHAFNFLGMRQGRLWPLLVKILSRGLISSIEDVWHLSSEGFFILLLFTICVFLDTV